MAIFCTHQTDIPGWRQELRDLGISALVAAPITTLLTFTESWHWIFTHPRMGLFAYCFNLGFWVVLGQGNSLITIWLNRHISWVERPVLRLWVGIVFLLLYSVPAIYVYVQFILWVFDYPYTFEEQRVSFYIALVITVVVSLFLNSRNFLLAWRESALTAERLRSEKLASDYEALRSQLNPHFLFNSLNVLSSLIELDPPQAVRYVERLSDIMRYVLDSRRQELVPLSEELHFIGQFLELQQLRFGKALQYEIGVQPREGEYVLPLSLQLLVENAIRHNALSAAAPLHLRIERQGPDLLVENNLQPKAQPTPGTGLGLANLLARYQFLSARSLQITQQDGRFAVLLPLL